MSERLVIDYAWDRPSAADIKDAGYEGVVRYLSRTESKNLTIAERDALRKEGLSIALVWETTANRSGQGRDAGVEDAKEAIRQAAALGYPDDCVLFFATDFDARIEQVRPYYQGVAATLPQRTPMGGYAGLAIVETLMREGLIDIGWQTVAWSGGKVSTMAHLYQRIKPTRPLGGDYDENVVLRGDYGQWKVFGSKPKPPERRLFMSLTPDEEKEILKASRVVNSPEFAKAIDVVNDELARAPGSLTLYQAVTEEHPDGKAYRALDTIKATLANIAKAVKA